MEYVPGPDFPTGGIINGREGIHKAYETGRGHIPLRAKAVVEHLRNGREMIVVTGKVLLTPEFEIVIES